MEEETYQSLQEEQMSEEEDKEEEDASLHMEQVEEQTEKVEEEEICQNMVKIAILFVAVFLAQFYIVAEEIFRIYLYC